MESLRARGIFSVLCEGGPTLGASLLGAGVVDRFYWAIAPRFLSGAARFRFCPAPTLIRPARASIASNASATTWSFRELRV